MAFGEPLGPAELCDLGDLQCVEALEMKGLVVSRVNGRRLQIRLAHPIFGDVLRSRVPVLRTRRIAASLAKTVEATGARRREDTLRIAMWRLDGGGGQPQLMTSAAMMARWRYDFPLAERLATAAVEAGAGFDAALLKAQLAGLQGRSAEAEHQLAKLAATVTDDVQRGLVAVNRFDNGFFYFGDVETGLRIAEQAESEITDVTWRNEVRVRRAAMLLATKGPRACVEALQPLIQELSGRVQVTACFSAAHGLARLGRIEEALATTERAHAAHLELTTPLDWDPCVHIYLRCEALAAAGRLKDAEALARSQYEQGVRDGNADAAAYFVYQMGKMVGEHGKVDSSIAWTQEAVSRFRQLGRPHLVQFCLVHQALALALGGHADGADEVIGEIDALGLPPMLYEAVDLLQARAWSCVAAGDLSHARALLHEAVDLGDRIGNLIGEASALHGLARLGRRSRRTAGRLQVLAECAESDMVRARATHVRALVHGDADALAGVSDEFEEMGAHLLAAEAAADASALLRRTGRERRAAQLAYQVRSLQSRCGRATTPALERLSDRPRLTRMERKVAVLASRDLSNRVIAEELVLSVRTVENHLHRAYDKLGISGRSQLSEALSAFPRR